MVRIRKDTQTALKNNFCTSFYLNFYEISKPYLFRVTLMKVRQLNCFAPYSKNVVLAPKRITCCRYEFFNWSFGNFNLVALVCLFTVPAIVDGCYYHAYPLLVCYMLLLINSLFSLDACADQTAVHICQRHG